MSKRETIATMNELPVEILSKVIEYITQKALPPLFYVNRRFRELASGRYYRSLILNGFQQIESFVDLVRTDETVGAYVYLAELICPDVDHSDPPESVLIRQCTAVLDFLSHCRRLKSLLISIKYTKKSDYINEWMGTVVELIAHEQLESLQLHCYTDITLVKMASFTLFNLRKLILRLPDVVTEAELLQLLQRTPKLTELSLIRPNEKVISDGFLDTLAQHCPHLQSLLIDHHPFNPCPATQQGVLRFICTQGDRLRQLALNCALTGHLDDVILQALYKYAPNLEFLRFRDCSKFGESEFLKFLVRLRKLRTVVLEKPNESIKMLAETACKHEGCKVELKFDRLGFSYISRQLILVMTDVAEIAGKRVETERRVNTIFYW